MQETQSNVVEKLKHREKYKRKGRGKTNKTSVIFN
jgi:hypothetical protein